MKDVWGRTLPAETIEMTRAELARLQEYSLSLPTGTTVGKRWKRNANIFSSEPALWVVGEYMDHPTDPCLVSIVWRRAVDPSAVAEPVASDLDASLALIDLDVE